MSLDFNPDTKSVSGVQFSIASPEEIREASVVEVTKTETYEKKHPDPHRSFVVRLHAPGPENHYQQRPKGVLPQDHDQ